MRAEGRLGNESLTAAGHEFRAGDRILCRRNSDSLGVRNGTRATVTAVEPTRGTLTCETDRGSRVEFSRGYLEAGHAQHAYALTGHAAQGLTVARAFVLGSDRGRLQEWGYVALSRASEETRLYLTGSQVEPDDHFQQLDGRDPLTRLAQALERTGSEQLAHDSRRPPVRAIERTRPVIVRRSPAERELESARAQLRTLNAQEERARELGERAKRRILAAQARLAGLGWRGRRRYGLELGRELTYERMALTAAENQLVELEPKRKRALERVLLAERNAPAREPVREIRPQLERERQQSLDLGW
jgi:hypothetical protein